MYRIIILITLLGLIFQTQLTAKEKPVVYTIGDSTVKNGRGDGSGGLWGWGDPFALFFDTTKVKVENHALGGTSSRTFQTKGLWEAVRTKLKKGDYLLMQFGHNDGARPDAEKFRGSLRGTGEGAQEVTKSRAEMPGGELYYLPRFNKHKRAVLYELGALSKEVEGHFQGTFVVDIDGLVKKVTLEGASNKKAAEVIEEIFQINGKWAPAKNWGRPVVSKFTFCVDLP